MKPSTTGALGRLLEDIALLHALGVRLVLVFGAEPQIDAALAARGLEARRHEGRRVLDEAALAAVVEVLGRLRSDIEAGLSRSLVDTPMAGARLRVVSGNLVSARPLGVLDGVDLGHTGCVRRIERDALGALLDAGHIVLLPPLGCSATGERFALTAEELAAAAAVALQADKLIALLEEPVEPPQRNGRPLRELGVEDALALAGRGGDGPWPARLRWAAQAARQGVGRVHLVDRRADGALLQELYTRDGAGLLVTAGGYEGLRRATLADVGGILRLIAPLEAEGVLVRRSREQLELEIDNFLVIERDGMVIACAALYPYAEAGRRRTRLPRRAPRLPRRRPRRGPVARGRGARPRPRPAAARGAHHAHPALVHRARLQPRRPGRAARDQAPAVQLAAQLQGARQNPVIPRPFAARPDQNRRRLRYHRDSHDRKVQTKGRETMSIDTLRIGAAALLALFLAACGQQQDQAQNAAESPVAEAPQQVEQAAQAAAEQAEEAAQAAAETAEAVAEDAAEAAEQAAEAAEESAAEIADTAQEIGGDNEENAQ
ncbi:MAG: hypothetical protein KatS3mg121_0788 [Gammaproteobacteria bacterium]|nr:MAG: hypothetical protein KatS3mg121_0788 [Gammaproteobacteria bacterium]